MKALSVMAILCLASCLGEASPYYDGVTNLWFSGQQSNVLAVANQRLASNTNDIGGLLMKASWDFYHASVSEASNTLVRVRDVGATVSTPKFSELYNSFLQFDIRCTLIYLSRATPANREEDHRIGSRPGHRMPYRLPLKALDDDGYFDNEAIGN